MEEDHGPRTVRTILSLIGLSREGLDERELVDLSGVSRLKVAAIAAGLDYHLVRKAGLLTFFHDYLRRAVEKRYLLDQRRSREHRTETANYFRGAGSSPRSAEEVMWQLGKIGAHEELARYLGDLNVLAILYGGARKHETQATWSELVDQGIEIENVYRKSIEETLRSEESPQEKYEKLGLCQQLLTSLGYWEMGATIAGEMVRLAEESGRQDRAAEAELRLADLHMRQGSHEEAFSVFDRLLQICTTLGDSFGMARALHGKGTIHMLQGDVDDALPCYEQALALRLEIDDRSGIAYVLMHLGNVYLSYKEFDKALDYYSRSLKICRELGEKSRAAAVVHNMGNVYRTRGEFDRALDAFRESLTIHEELGERSDIARVLSNMGALQVDRREFERALECNLEALAIHQDLGEKGGVAHVLTTMGWLSMMRGEFDQALEYCNQSLELHRELGDRRRSADVNGYLGNLYSSLGEFDRSLESYQEAYATYLELGEESMGAMIGGNIGSIYKGRGEHDRALAYYEDALAIHQERGDEVEAASIVGNIGSLFMGQGDLERAYRCSLEALVTHRKAGLDRAIVYWAERLSEILLTLSQSGEEPPDYLRELVPDIKENKAGWKESARKQARAYAAEAFEVLNRLSHHEQSGAIRVLLARLDEVEGKQESARRSLKDLLAETESQSERATLPLLALEVRRRRRGASQRSTTALHHTPEVDSKAGASRQDR